ncbi:MAG: hypothetical protein JXR76_29730 [Deltaproteobacteria bacterium]|nr:hypothetical protein [Deltaproteobacteria bacterium]
MKFNKIAVVMSLVFLALGCGLAEGPREKLDRGLFQFNEGLRWGRYSDVLPVVDADAREHFQKMHEEWGTTILITAADVLQVLYNDRERKADISVRYSWYRKKEMTAYDTVTKQHWEYRVGKWWLVAEEFQSGQPF